MKKLQKTSSVINLQLICKNFEIWNTKTSILKNINLEIKAWEFVAIMWKSWSWKSTILNMIWLLDKPSSGKIFINWKNVANLNDIEQAKIRLNTFWFIFQQYNLIPWLTAYENICLPLIFADKKANYDEIKSYMEKVWIGDRINHKPLEMSWWEQQRVALLRALVNNPEIILWDEPTWNLDSQTWEKIMEIFVDLNKKQWKTIILVTHDPNVAKMANKIIKVKDWEIV